MKKGTGRTKDRTKELNETGNFSIGRGNIDDVDRFWKITKKLEPSERETRSDSF
jgi:hypothetical protein